MAKYKENVRGSSTVSSHLINPKYLSWTRIIETVGRSPGGQVVVKNDYKNVISV